MNVSWYSINTYLLPLIRAINFIEAMSVPVNILNRTEIIIQQFDSKTYERKSRHPYTAHIISQIAHRETCDICFTNIDLTIVTFVSACNNRKSNTTYSVRKYSGLIILYMRNVLFTMLE